MSNNIRQQAQAKINISINNLETVSCPNCKNFVFETNLSIFKKLLSIQSPNGKAQLIKIDLIACPSCNRFFQAREDKLLPIILEELNDET